MKKCLSLLLALSLVLSMCVLPVSAETEVPAWVNLPDGAELIFAEDFESGFADGNLLVEGSKTVEITNTKTNKKAMKFNYNDATMEQVTVEAGPDAFNTSKVLKLHTTNPADFNSRIYLDGGNDFSVTDPASPYYGKQIVVEYDAMVSGANGNQDNPFMQLRSSTGTADTTPTYLGYNNNQIQFRHGAFANASTAETWKKDWYTAYQTPLSSKNHVKFVVEQNLTDFDSTRFYFNNALVNRAASQKTDWNTGRMFKDFIYNGAVFAVNGYDQGGTSLKKSYDYGNPGAFYSEVRAKSGSSATIYVDNIVVYVIDALNFTGFNTSVGVDLEAGVVANFSAPFDATTDTFALSLASDDTKIEGAIKEVVMSNGGKTATVKFDTAVLGDNKEFKLWAAEDLTSKAGAIFYKDLDGVKEGEEYVELAEFLTYIPFELVEQPEGLSNLIPNDPRKVEIKTTTPAANVTATYAGGNVTVATLGTSTFISFENIDTPVDGDVVVALTSEDGQTAETTFAVTAKSDEIEYIYNDNLEGLAEGQLITDGSAKNYTNGKFAFTTSAASLAEAGTVEVVTDAEQGKVLKMSTLSAGHFGVLYDAGQTYDTDAKTDSVKVLVIQTKYNIPANAPSNDGINYGAINNYASSTTGGRALSLRYTGATAYISMGRWNSAGADLNNTEVGSNIKKGQWVEYTTVVDQSHVATNNNPHTFRFYNDGALVSKEVYNYKKVYPEATVVPKVYDWANSAYQGLWDHSGLAPIYASTGSYATIAMGDFRGTFTQIPVAKKLDQIDTYKHSIYIDDFRAFFADKFVVTSVSENAAAFIPTRHTLKVVFNQKVDAAQKSYITLVDEETGAVVEGLEVASANGGYALDFKLPATVETGKSYKLVFTPEFYDITSYQGLTTNNHNYEIGGITIADFVAFTAKADTKEVINFTQGKDAKSVITLSVATKLTDSDAKSAFDVVNDEGVAVTEGWTAKVSADQMSITLDFTNLATDNYTVTSNDKLVNKDGDKLDGEAVVITITAKEGIIMIFEEDFDGTGEDAYALDTNWLEEGNLPANGKFDAKSYIDQYANTASTVEGNSVTVTSNYPEAATSLSGNALKVYATNTAAAENIVKVKAKSQLGAIDIEKDYPNKVIVVEGDMYMVYTDNGNADNVSRLFAPSFADDMKMAGFHKYDGGNIKFEGTWLSTPSNTQKADALRHRWTNGIGISKKSNTKIQFVLDQRSGLDTAKMIVGGKQLTERNHTLLVDHPNFNKMFYEFPMAGNSTNDNAFGEKDMGDFYGFFLPAKAKPSSSVGAEVYYDNLKAYLVDAFEITGMEGGSTAFNPAKDTVKINFTNKLLSQEDAQANISVINVATGNAEAATITLADGGYQAVVDIDDQLTGGEYKIVVSPLIKDEYGISLASKWIWHDYKETVGEGWAVLKSNGNIVSLHATEAEAEAAKGTNTVQKYTWTMNDASKGKVNNFTIASTTTTSPNTFIASGYVRDDAEMNLETIIITTKATSLYAEAAKAVVDGANVSVDLTFVNPEEDTLPVWYIVAAYGEYNEMIGCKAEQLYVEKGTLNKPGVSFTAKSDDIQSIKLYVWDGYKTMVPYQDAEDLK